MAKTLFSIDIRDDYVSGVLFQITSKAVVVEGCSSAWVEERPIKDVIRDVMELAGVRDGICRVSFPAEHFFFRNLSLPFTDIGKIRKILPYELEESAPMEIHNLLVDAISAKSAENGSEIIAVMAERKFFAERLALLLELGLDPEIITISGLQTAVRLSDSDDCPSDFILLDIGLKWANMFVVQDKNIVLIRPLYLGNDGFSEDSPFDDELSPVTSQASKPTPSGYKRLATSMKHTLLVVNIENLPIYLTGPDGRRQGLAEYLQNIFGVETKCFDLLKEIPFVKVAPNLKARWIPEIMDQALALGMRSGRSRKWLNFRKGDFAKKISIRQHRHLISRVAAATAVLILSICFSCLYSYTSGKAEEKKLTQQIRSVFSKTLPAVSRVVDPIQQLQVEINKLKQATNDGGIGTKYGVLDILAEISRSIPTTLKVHLTLMMVDEKSVRLKGTTDNFNTVDNIKKKLEKSSYFSSVGISSANLAPKGNEIRFELRLRLRGA